MRTNKVIVVSHDPSWAENFIRIQDELKAVLGEKAIRIEHVGSTSVPGLAAKPIIDLDIVISDNEDFEVVVSKMESAGYLHEGNLGISGREAFCYEGKKHLQRHHPYVCRESSQELKRHITFRDYLRINPDDAKLYGEVKQEAARLFPDRMDLYMKYKSDCIRKLYKKCGLE